MCEVTVVLRTVNARHFQICVACSLLCKKRSFFAQVRPLTFHHDSSCFDLNDGRLCSSFAYENLVSGFCAVQTMMIMLINWCFQQRRHMLFRSQRKKVTQEMWRALRRSVYSLQNKGQKIANIKLAKVRNKSIISFTYLNPGTMFRTGLLSVS